MSHLRPCRAVPVPGGGGPRKDPRPVRLLWTVLEDRSCHLSCHAALWTPGLACRVASCWRILCSTVCAALLLWSRETLQGRSSQSSLLLVSIFCFSHFPPNFYHTYICVFKSLAFLYFMIIPNINSEENPKQSLCAEHSPVVVFIIGQWHGMHCPVASTPKSNIRQRF